MTVKIVRAQKKCPKAVPTHFQNHVVQSWAFKCSVKSYVTGPLTRGPHTSSNKTNQRLRGFGVSRSPSFVLGLTPGDGFLKIIQVVMKHDPFDAM